ncbi:uncharacterized protein MEPE_03883 [Melanopsichium pennsylvanicum]|uniref:Mitochondrial carrier protein n=2 Tax=Melanopsichium pennsylvanicum TaxID=63383 RepID=A0AAJ4XMP0_9BASI|nr:conserved hypothetical protein [Melanopsichium pennsylvanicum 4]SNX85174.1 uncharacterized protein MEPE_03883 [Melanopsichium pennsylvanicum]
MSATMSQAGPSTSDKQHKKITKRRRSTSANKREPTRQESFGGAVIRALFGTLAFLFKRPVRLFRPVKLSSWTILEAMAKREGRSLSLRYLRTLLRRENSNFLPHLLLPPLLFNTAIGFTLFEAYSITESRLLTKSKLKNSSPQGADELGDEEAELPKPRWTPLWIVTASGAVAGAAQCFLSAPLDNVRYIIQRNVSGPDPHHRSAHARTITTISWRAILRAAILPFAPAIARDKLVQDVQNEAIERSKRAPKPTLRARLIAFIEPATTSLRNASNGNGSVREQFTISPEKRKEWEKRLKRWRGGVHGSGLALSLIRDSVGFGSFFFIFEVSRRCAFFASTGVDRVSAWFNAKGLGLAGPAGSQKQAEAGSNVVGRWKSDGAQDQGEMHIQDSGRIGQWIRQGQKGVPDADVSYNQSRTVQGRVVAVIILLVGGAVGAFSYELVGRPFELMRVVIWEGRKQWEQGKREPGYRPARTHKTYTRAHTEGETASGFTTTGRSVVRGARANAAARAEKLGSRAFRRRPDFLVLRAENTSGKKVSRIHERAMISRPPHPLRFVPASSKWCSPGVNGTAVPMLTSSRALQKRKAQRNSFTAPPRIEITPESGSHKRTLGRITRRPTPTLATRPGFLTLLIEHAQSTAKLDKLHSGGLDPSKVSIPLLLLHTYFIAPFLPEIPKPVLDNEIVRTAAGVDRHLRPSSILSRVSSGDSIGDKISTVAQRTLLMSLASRRRSTDSPEAKLKRNWIRNNPVNFSLANAGKATNENQERKGATATLQRRGGFGASDKGTLQRGTRYWASGRVVWTLKRLATPYGVAFLVFAWLGGDLN